MSRAIAPRWLADAARPAVHQPLRWPVPADDAAHWRRKGPLKLAFRNARRWVQFATSGQARLLRHAIDPAWRSCLWIHNEAPNVGDALMDLAPRSLLRARGIEVDLLAAPHLVALFAGDRWFRRCASDGGALQAARYDFVIVASHGRRALQPKQRCVPALPWISLAGFYSVPDFNRSLFATRRLADLLRLDLDPAGQRLHSRQKLDPAGSTGTPPAAAGGSGPRVGLALGGVRPDRTYGHWPAVIALLDAAGVRSFVLAGSANGRQALADVTASAPPGVVLHDCVERTDLLGARAALAACDLVVCADGGLMHLALTTSARVLPLFSGTIDPRWRLPLDFDREVLRSQTSEVSGIAAADIADAALRALDIPLAFGLSKDR